MNTCTSIRYTDFETRLGRAIIACDDAGICGFWFDGQRHFAGIQDDWQRDDDEPRLRTLIAQYREYERGERTRFELPLAPHGTPFQRSVWQALAGIPFGKTCSYGSIAQSIGAPAAVRAVGAAVGRNPISVIVPCHRVLGSDGSLTGYAGGLDRKRALLSLEGAHA